MPATSLKYRERQVAAQTWGAARPLAVEALAARPDRLADLARLASADIETALVANLSDDLHTLFDPVCEDVLPIYFGPLLGRLYLEGL